MRSVTEPTRTLFMAMILFAFSLEVRLASSNQHCAFRATADRSIEFTGAKAGHGVTRLEARAAKSIQECENACCATEHCNTATFFDLGRHMPRGITNCFLTHCNTVTGCHSQAKSNYYLLAMDGAMVQPLQPQPHAHRSPTPTRTTQKTSTVFTATGATVTTVTDHWGTSAMALSEDNSQRQSPAPTWHSTNSSSSTSTSSKASSTTTHNIHPLPSSTANPNSETELHQKWPAGASQIIPSQSSNSQSSYLIGNGTNTTDYSPIAPVSKASGVLMFLLIVGIILMLTSVYIMWKINREVKVHRYKEIVFLLNDNDGMYA